MEIESVGELFIPAGKRVKSFYWGFGEKTQQNIVETIKILHNRGSFLFHKGGNIGAT